MFSKKKIYTYSFLFFCTFLLGVFSHHAINTGGPFYDERFHMIRIVGLAQSLKHGDYLPSLNHIFAYGTGYAVPMFYGNFLLYFPAIMYLITHSITISFTLFAAFLMGLTSVTSYYSFEKIIGSKKAIWVSVITPLLFPSFGYGMTMVVFLVPLLIYSVYKVLYEEKYNPILLGVVIALLIQNHILSTVILALTTFVYLVIHFQKVTVKSLKSFLKSTVIGLLLSIGFLVQYVEQVSSQMFFFNWRTRDFPVSSITGFSARSVLENLVQRGPYPSDGSYFTSLSTIFDFAIIAIVSYLMVNWKEIGHQIGNY